MSDRRKRHKPRDSNQMGKAIVDEATQNADAETILLGEDFWALNPSGRTLAKPNVKRKGRGLRVPVK